MSEIIKDLENQTLVPVFEGEIGGVKQPVVNGRTLHDYVRSAQKFADWMKSRIDEYEFIEGVHFLVSETYDTKAGRGVNRKARFDYTISLDMAKELAMVERTEMGRAARRYFIQCETELKQKQLDLLKKNNNTEKEDKEISYLYELARSRSHYWAMKKRDLFYDPKIDHDLLFSVFEDIEYSINEEHYRDLRKKFPLAYSSEYYSEMKAFTKNWTPRFFRKNLNFKVV